MNKIIDLHQDISSAHTHPTLKKQTDFVQLEKASIKLVLGTGFTLPEEKLPEVIARDFLFYEKHFKQNLNWSMIKTQEDVRAVMSSSNARGIIFHIEGFPEFNGDWRLLDKWYRQGLRSAGLVWNDDNPLGGGTNSDLGLTKIGREFISRCEERGILIDLAHANQTMFKDCLEVTRKPPFISHGGLNSLVSNRRNYTDEQLKEIAERGGIVGIFFAKSCMAINYPFSVADIVTHIKMAVRLLGEDNVAIGTDFGGMISGTPKELSSMSQLENLWQELESEGMRSTQIEKIASLNAYRYLTENLPQISKR